MQSSEFISNQLFSGDAIQRERVVVGINLRIAVVVMLALSALMAVDRIYGPSVPLNVDPASYAVASHELLNGKNLYTDIWDHKPPAPFITYAAAELVFGYSDETLHILNFLACIGVLWGIFLAAKYGPGKNVSGLVAAFLWTIVSGSFGLEARDPNTEIFINVFVVFAFYLIVANRKDGLSILKSIVVGSLFLWASLYKPVVAANLGLITLALVLFAENRRHAIHNTLTIGAICVSGWLLMFAYFYATGRGEIFFTSVITYNKYYSGSLLANVAAPVFGQASVFVDVIGPLAIFAIIGTVCAFLYERRLGILITAYVISSWIALSSAGKFSVHYYQLWLPALIIASAWGIGYFSSSPKTIQRVFAWTACLSLTMILVIYQLPNYKAATANKFIPKMRVLNSAEVTAGIVNSLLRSDETFYVWGNTPNLYLLTNRRPAAGILFDSHVRENPLSLLLTEHVGDQLDRSRPELLVVQLDRPSAPEWLTKDFETTPIYSDQQNYSIYARTGGRLAAKKNFKGDTDQKND